MQVTKMCIEYGTCLKREYLVDANRMINNRAEISESCRGCGRCVDICPQNAIELVIEDKEFVEKTIKQIEKIIDVT